MQHRASASLRTTPAVKESNLADRLVIPWVLLGTGRIPGGGDALRLFRRGAEFSIRTRDAELMNSRLSGSEEALATQACGRLGTRPRPHVLIGGLGMGFTLAAALKALNTDAQVTVCELVPEVVAWARGPMAALFGDSLGDPRVRLVEDDVGRLIDGARGAYDAILLDVDNGPEAMTQAGNDRLYAASGLTASRHALKAGGVLAVWSAHRDAAFAKRLAHAGFKVDEVCVRANRGRRGARHTIWLATVVPRRS